MILSHCLTPLCLLTVGRLCSVLGRFAPLLGRLPHLTGRLVSVVVAVYVRIGESLLLALVAGVGDPPLPTPMVGDGEMPALCIAVPNTSVGGRERDVPAPTGGNGGYVIQYAIQAPFVPHGYVRGRMCLSRCGSTSNSFLFFSQVVVDAYSFGRYSVHLWQVCVLEVYLR